MIRNYFQTAVRNILRNKKISLINIIGLSLSMSVCMLIIVIIQDQYAYDNFIEQRGKLYRIQTIDNLSKYAFNKYASTTFPLAKKLRDNYPFGNSIIALNNSFRGEAEYENRKIPISGLYAETDFFDMFSFNLAEGSAASALSEPWSIVLTREVAERYFGNEQPLGKTLVIEGMGNFNVTGVVDQGKNKSHIQFESLVSSSTMESLQSGAAARRLVTDWKDFNSSYVYIRLDDPSMVETVEEALREISEEMYDEDEKTDVTFYLFPFNSIVPGPVLGNELGMSMPKVYLLLFGGLGLVIILSAAFNYTSLSVARSMTRAKEFGVRKTLGASKRQVTFMIYIEAIIISVLAMVAGVIILQFLLPAFKGMKMMSLLEIDPSQNLTVYAWFLLFAVATGIMAGSLPAIYISRITPVAALQGSSAIKLFKRLTFRKILLVSQYFFSIVFIITVILIFRQMNYMAKADMGFDRDMVFNLRLQRNDFSLVADRISRVKGVISVSGVSHVPGVGNLRDAEVKLSEGETAVNSHYFAVTPGYVSTLGLTMLAGGDFPADLNSPDERFVIISRLAAEKFGFETPPAAIGRNIIVDDTINLEVTGVVENYTYCALFLPVRPLLLRAIPSGYRYATIRVKSDDHSETISAFRNVWEEIDQSNQFDGYFLEDEVKEYYSFFEDIEYTIAFTTFLAIVIACLGLFGMASYSIQTRRREVGIHKVYGAGSLDILLLVSKSSLILLSVSAVIAIPVAYIINNAWISFIADHVSFGAGTVLAGVIVVILMGLLSISGQALSVSRTRPADTLKYE